MITSKHNDDTIRQSVVKEMPHEKKRWCELSDWQILAVEQAVQKLDKSIAGVEHLQRLIASATEIKIR